jgi:hypothetical protein
LSTKVRMIYRDARGGITSGRFAVNAIRTEASRNGLMLPDALARTAPVWRQMQWLVEHMPDRGVIVTPALKIWREARRIPGYRSEYIQGCKRSGLSQKLRTAEEQQRYIEARERRDRVRLGLRFETPAPRLRIDPLNGRVVLGNTRRAQPPRQVQTVLERNAERARREQVRFTTPDAAATLTAEQIRRMQIVQDALNTATGSPTWTVPRTEEL